MTGRGAWTRIGMPSNGTPYYQLVAPVNVGAEPGKDDAHRAVMYGVKAIQTRINEQGYVPALVADGWLGAKTVAGIVWVQKKLGVTADGIAGPTTLKHMLWPYVSAVPYSATVRQIVGGICQHESGWDPGAVGYSTPEDIGLVQINGPANPKMSEADRFDYHKAYDYAANRINSALNTPSWTKEAAIASYGYPAVATYWVQVKAMIYPKNPALNVLAVDYVNFIKAWTPGF